MTPLEIMAKALGRDAGAATLLGLVTDEDRAYRRMHRPNHRPAHFFYTDARGVRRKQTIPSWTLDQAVALINELLPDARACGWNLALNGSVLYNGCSNNDVDIIAHPMIARKNGIPAYALGPRVADLYSVLCDHGLTQHRTVEEIHEYWRATGSLDEKHVEVWVMAAVYRADAGYEGAVDEVHRVKRIDLFILS